MCNSSAREVLVILFCPLHIDWFIIKCCLTQAGIKLLLSEGTDFRTFFCLCEFSHKMTPDGLNSKLCLTQQKKKKALIWATIKQAHCTDWLWWLFVLSHFSSCWAWKLDGIFVTVWMKVIRRRHALKIMHYAFPKGQVMTDVCRTALSTWKEKFVCEL